MAATISVPALRASSRAGRFLTISVQLALAAVVVYLGVYQLVWLAVLVLVVTELSGGVWRRERTVAGWFDRLAPFIIGVAVVVMAALSIRAASQVALMLLYGGWRAWRVVRPAAMPANFWELLALQAVSFEAIFLAADRWHEYLSRPLTLVIIWLVTYVLAYQALAMRQERAAGVLAAAWALVVTEAAWVFLTWLVSYVTPGHYLVVPQAALALTGLAYCLGSIYLAQRTGTLSRTRFTEYLLIGLILIWIVIAGTQWKGTIQ